MKINIKKSNQNRKIVLPMFLATGAYLLTNLVLGFGTTMDALKLGTNRREIEKDPYASIRPSQSPLERSFLYTINSTPFKFAMAPGRNLAYLAYDNGLR